MKKEEKADLIFLVVTAESLTLSYYNLRSLFPLMVPIYILIPVKSIPF